MKRVSLLLVFCSFFLLSNAQENQLQLTVRQQLENLNSYWKANQINEPLLQQKLSLPDDVSLIQTHLSLVEKTLRKKETKQLSPEQQQNRQHCLDILHTYWQNGVFPINTYHAERTPYFIDNYGTACAVGQLVISTGYADVASKIHDENNYAYIKELNQQYPELQAWANVNGFEMDELAWIQPAYYCDYGSCPAGTVRNVMCYGENSGCVGIPTNVTGGTPPYSFHPEYWNNNQWLHYSSPINQLCDLSPGLYRYLAIDAVGDSMSLEYTITQPDPLVVNVTTTDDNGTCNGTAIAQVTGGVPPYWFNWGIGDTSQAVSNLCSRAYYCEVLDSNNCYADDTTVFIGLAPPTTSVTHGPIVGGVTETSVRVFVRTDAADSVQVQFSTAANFSTIAKTFSGQTNAARDSSNIFAVTGLSADTKYHVRVLVNGTESGHRSSFKTFPQAGTAGNYKLLFGSCQYDLSDLDSSLFVQMKTEDANIFTPTGDWGYPDKDNGTNDVYFSNPPTSWAADYNKVRTIYKERFASSNSSFFLRTIALDYTHDDHDYLNDNTGRDAANIFEINPVGGNFGEPKSVTQPAQARLNVLKGYDEFFPGYDLVDSTEGIFHSYVIGNCEVFVLDTRSARTPQHDAIKEVGGQWVIQEPAGHTILGQTQMNWLLNGLLNSTAEWKFIVSSVTFNAGYKAVLDSLLSFGKGSSPILGITLGGTSVSTGLIGAGQMSDLWVGFPSDQQAVLNHIATNDLKNIFVISGDAHSAALDDGTNSGIPELMSANLKKANSEDPIILSNFIGHPLWNKGASGIGNTNFNSTYGKVEVFGKDSMRMSAVDAAGVEVCGYTFKYEPDSTIGIAEVNAEKFKVYPNPSSGKLFIETDNAQQNFIFSLLSLEGKEIKKQLFTGKAEISLTDLPKGNYLYRIADEKSKMLTSGVVSVVQE